MCRHILGKLVETCFAASSIPDLEWDGDVPTNNENAMNETFHSNNETLSPTPAPTDSGPSTFIVIPVLLVVLCIFITVILFLVNTPAGSGGAQGRSQPDEEESMDPEAIRKRNLVIDHWLVAAEGVAHDEACKQHEEQGRGSSAWTRECQICMDEIKVGDKVAWSLKGCDHVYHFSCIQSWLLKKSDCPSCRQPMIPVDCEISEDREDGEMDTFRRDRQETAFYCVQHGFQTTKESRCTPTNVAPTPSSDSKTGPKGKDAPFPVSDGVVPVEARISKAA